MWPTPVLDLPRRPDSVVVFGGGAHGCEIAQGLARLGPDGHLDRTRPPAARRPAGRRGAGRRGRAARRRGPHDHPGPAGQHRPDPGRRCLGRHRSRRRRRRRSVRTGHSAAGRAAQGWTWPRPESRSARAGQVVVDDRLRAGSGGVFACGEVTGLLAYGSSPAPMARVVAANVAAGDRRGGGVAYQRPIPVRITRTDPEVAVVGQVGDLGDGAVRGVGEGPVDGSSVELVVAPAGGHPRWSLLGRAGHSGRVLVGATLVGAGAAEAAGQLVLAATAALPAATLIDIEAPAGTWAAAVQGCMARTLAGERTPQPPSGMIRRSASGGRGAVVGVPVEHPAGGQRPQMGERRRGVRPGGVDASRPDRWGEPGGQRLGDLVPGRPGRCTAAAGRRCPGSARGTRAGPSEAGSSGIGRSGSGSATSPSGPVNRSFRPHPGLVPAQGQGEDRRLRQEHAGRALGDGVPHGRDPAAPSGQVGLQGVAPW